MKKIQYLLGYISALFGLNYLDTDNESFKAGHKDATTSSKIDNLFSWTWRIRINGVTITTTKRLRVILSHIFNYPEQNQQKDACIILGIYEARVFGLCFYRNEECFKKFDE